MITTARNLQDVGPDDIAIADLAKAGLARPCVVRLARLATFEWSERIRRSALSARQSGRRSPRC